MMGTVPADEVVSVGEPRPTRLSVAALRRAVARRMWGGKGCGAPCDFCRVLVGPSDVEYEVEAELEGAVVMLHFHPRCHDSWSAGQEPTVSATNQEAASPPKANQEPASSADEVRRGPDAA
jgi:hypothetical protein